MNRNLVIGIFALILVIVFGVSAGSIWETVPSNEIVVIQGAIDGELHVFIGGTATGGVVSQNFGTPTHYKKSFQFWFSKAHDQGDATDQSIKIRFNDGGHAQMSGSVRINLPLDEKSIIALHTNYGSEEAIQTALIRTTIEKAVYMTGPLMSSKESYAEKRNDLIYYIEDQAKNGVYRTKTTEKKIKDELSGTEKTVSVVDIVTDTTKGIHTRQEVSQLQTFNIELSALSLNSIDYDDAVEKQIQQQQSATMQVQTAMANAKRAEQDAITVAKQGEASAAKAKWEQEVKKAQAVTEAEQYLAVQKLATQTADLYKQQQILEGQGDAEKKRLIMSADGAIDQKLVAYQAVQKYWADAFSKYQGNIVPLYQTGSLSGNGSNGASQFMELMGMKAAKDLGLDMTMQKGGNK